jgi:signal transduction histidine kinase
VGSIATHGVTGQFRMTRFLTARFANRPVARRNACIAAILLAVLGGDWGNLLQAQEATENFSTDLAHQNGGRPAVRLQLEASRALRTGQFVAGTERQEVRFDSPATGRYFCLESLSAQDGRAYAAVAELDLLDAAGQRLSRAAWRIAYCDSEEHERENGAADHVIDNDPGTIWHTEWGRRSPSHPHHLILDLGESRTVAGFSYLPRQNRGAVGGFIKEYRAYVGNDLLQVMAPEQTLPDHCYVFGYFAATGEPGLRLAYSLNGYRWDGLNRGDVVLKPEVGEKIFRDPALFRAADGTFHLVWTAGWASNYIGYASSRDLIHWSEQTAIPVMASEPGTVNCWAPDIFWDERKAEFMLLWTSTVASRPETRPINNRIYFATTKDFKTFSPPQVLYAPGPSIKDATLIQERGRFYLLFREDRAERLRMVVADHPEGPFRAAGDVTPIERAWGPISFRRGDQRFVLFQNAAANRIFGVKTSDLEHWEEISGGLILPFGSGQGAVVEIAGTNLVPFLSSGRLEIGNTPAASELGLGDWIWPANVSDRQACHLWRAFDIPSGSPVVRAELRMTADNSYVVYLDGREIGRGGDVNNLAEYDLTWFLSPGRHVLAVEAFNDTFDAGVVLGLRATLANGERVEIFSDLSWRVADNSRNWKTQKQAAPSWVAPQVVGFVGKMWWTHPNKMIQVPPSRPPPVHFWQNGWVLAGAVLACLTIAILWARQGVKLALQKRASQMLERERARIARDMHDDLGSGLTQLTLLGEGVRRDMAGDNETRSRMDELCGRTRALLQTMDEIVWAVNPRRDTVRDFAAFVSEYAQEFLAATSIRCRQEVMDEMPDVPLNLPERRNLLLAVKEAIRNAARHSGSNEIKLQLQVVNHVLQVVVADNGKGFASTQARADRNGLLNMQQRLADIGGTFELLTAPGQGCCIMFQLPLHSARRISNS